MRVTAVIQWMGPTVGWEGCIRLSNGTEIRNRSHKLTTVRIRLRRLATAHGIKNPELVEEYRIPEDLQKGLTDFQKQVAERSRLEATVADSRLEIAHRLLGELQMSEREAAEWLGVSHAYLSRILGQTSTDIVAKADAKPEAKSKRSRSTRAS